MLRKSKQATQRSKQTYTVWIRTRNPLNIKRGTGQIKGSGTPFCLDVPCVVDHLGAELTMKALRGREVEPMPTIARQTELRILGATEYGTETTHSLIVKMLKAANSPR